MLSSQPVESSAAQATVFDGERQYICIDRPRCQALAVYPVVSDTMVCTVMLDWHRDERLLGLRIASAGRQVGD